MLSLVFTMLTEPEQRKRNHSVYSVQREIFRFKKQSTKEEEDQKRVVGRYHVRDAISLCVSLDDCSFSLSLQWRPWLFDRDDGASDMTDRSDRGKTRGNVEAHGRRQIVAQMRDDIYNGSTTPGQKVSPSLPIVLLPFPTPGRSIADIQVHTLPRQIRQQRNEQIFITGLPITIERG